MKYCDTWLEEMIVRKSTLNLLVDALLLLTLACTVGIGFLMKYVLVPGHQRWEIYGRNVDLLFWGWDRHEWGTVHFVIGLIFLVLLVLHIILHWSLIVRLYCGLIRGRLARWAIALTFICVTVIIIVPKVGEGRS